MIDIIKTIGALIAIFIFAMWLAGFLEGFDE
jgi:hypothetical protein